MRWKTDQIPDQSGRTAVVTGANSGLGLIVARELTRAGARVVLACRNTDKGKAAVGEIEALIRDAKVDVAELDLSSLDSVRTFADRFKAEHGKLDLLINNAGVMAPPRRETPDGHEQQFATNHLGHFALTGLLLSSLCAVDGSRVVTLSSSAHRMGKINFDDLDSKRRYRRWRAYGQSKLANLMFALELDRRLQRAGLPSDSLAAHPGYAATNLQSASPPLIDRAIMTFTNRLLAQSAEMGALPVLYAATLPGLAGGSFVGPDGRGEMRGYPTIAVPSPAALDEGVAARLWAVSEDLTGVRFDLPGGVLR